MVTTFLAAVIGWYLVIICLFMLFRYDLIKSIAHDIMSQRGLFFIVAILTLILGLMMVVSHNIWVMGWPVVVTLFSWLVLISGIIRLFRPEIAMKMGQSFLNDPNRIKIASIVLLLLGLFLLLHVYYL